MDEAKNVSAIAIFSAVHVPRKGPIPPDAQALMKWDVLTVWLRHPSDGDRMFEQAVALLAPDGSETHIKATSRFAMTKESHRVVTTVFGFPIAKAGQYVLSLQLKAADADGPATEVAQYPVTVVHRDEGANATDAYEVHQIIAEAQ